MHPLPPRKTTSASIAAIGREVTMAWFLRASLVNALLLMPIAVNAQNNGSATIYGKGHFKGPSISLSGPRQRIDPPFVVRSIRIPEGSAWELCTGSTFSGCRRIDKPMEAAVFTVRSARPVAAVLVASGSILNVSGTLRGVASEFFVAPNRDGQRLATPDNNPEAMRDQANEFCQSTGWQESAHARLLNDGGTYYLVDVLCVNKGS